MKSIFFFARDPGGANALTPVILSVKGEYRAIVFGKDYAIEYFRRSGITCEDIRDHCQIIDEKSMADLLEIVDPDLLFTGTSSDDYTEKYLWTAAKKVGIDSVALIDSWVNLGIRFSQYSLSDVSFYLENKDIKYLPDYILVMDDYSKQEMISEGIPESIIYVTGQPYLEYIQKRILQTAEKDVKTYRANIGCKKNTKLIVYASDNISKDFKDTDDEMYWGYNEKSIFTYIFNALNDFYLGGKDFILLIRPHPKEDMEFWEKVVSNNSGMKLIVERDTAGDIIIKAADLVISMQSMFLIEAALAHKEIMSLQIGLKRQEPLILSKLGVINSILDYNKFKSELEFFFEEKGQKANWNVAGNALKKINGLIKEILWED